MKVYHGTISTCVDNIITNGIKLSKGKPKVDFGQGFYTTSDKEFAISTAKNKAKKTNIYKKYNFCFPALVKLDLEESMFPSFNILRFDDINVDWAQFIINNRNGYKYMNQIQSSFHNIDSKYDMVFGPIADKQITTIASELKILNEKISLEELSGILYSYPTEQISFHSIKSLSCISTIKYDIILL